MIIISYLRVLINCPYFDLAINLSDIFMNLWLLNLFTFQYSYKYKLMLMETKTVSRCIHNGFNTEETNSNCPIDPVIPVPPLYNCCFIITQSVIMFINATVNSQYSSFIFRRSWIPFFTQRAVISSKALCGFPQSFVH